MNLLHMRRTKKWAVARRIPINAHQHLGLIRDTSLAILMDVAAARMSEVVRFVSEYRWVYDVQMTKLFAEEWWKSMPKEVRYNFIIQNHL